MLRLFKRHTKRDVTLLDGIWRFCTDPHRRGMDEEWFKVFPKESRDMVVPSCWNNTLGLYDYEGLAWYATTFEMKTNAAHIKFHGVTGLAKVYVDGTLIGEHYGGFIDFGFTVQAEIAEHTLVVAVDNTHDTINTIPLARVDWFHYGGIIRSVELIHIHDAWISNCNIGYVLDKNLQNVTLKIQATIEAPKKILHNQTVQVYIDNQLICRKTVDLQEHTTITFDNVEQRNIQLWDVDNPKLYYIRIETDTDDIIERIGFRDIKTKDRKILLNNKELFLKGINRHEEHPDWGFAVPFHLMKKDMDIIKMVGCNAIRGSHYPNSEIFLDLCDQEGILFWEEIPMWGFPEEALSNPLVINRGLTMLKEMVLRDFHHPSVIIWGMHNEVASHTNAGVNITKVFSEKIRSLDSSRLLTHASNHPFDDLCYKFGDIVCINQYIGWYDGELSEWPEFLAKLKEKLAKDNLSDMPIVISEFGAGGIYGDCTFESPKWTENYQAKYLAETLRTFLEDEDICGTYIWQFCDIRTAKELALNRPRSFNNKGIVNEYRKPKIAYWTVKEIYENALQIRHKKISPTA